MKRHPRERKSQPWSLAFRLSAWYAVSGFLLIAIPTIYLYKTVLHDVYYDNYNDVAERVDALSVILRHVPLNAANLRQAVEVEPLARPRAPYMVRVFGAGGPMLDQTPGMAANLSPRIFPAPRPVGQSPGVPELYKTAAGQPFLLLSKLIAADAPTAGATSSPAAAPAAYRIQIAMDESSDERMLAAYRSHIWLVMLVGLVACIVISYLIAHNGLRPVGEMERIVSGIRSTSLTQRIHPAGFPRELSSLADRFNGMLDRLEDAFERLSRFSADIAHELRTPLNNLRGETEVSLGKPRSGDEYRDVLSSCLEEYVRLSRMIDSLLFLARAENPETQINRERVDIEHELQSIRDFFEPSAEERGIDLTVIAPAGLSAHVDRLLLQRAIGNLVENALAFTQAGGKVTITAMSESRPTGMFIGREGGDSVQAALLIEVSDTGCGIPAEHLPYIFDRFRQVDEARSKERRPVSRSGMNADGTPRPAGDADRGAPKGVTLRAGLGLGLSIVRGIATLHGGAAEIESQFGSGTCVRLIFPQ